MTRSKLNRPVVVAVGKMDENSGGAIVLHTLVDRLRRAGVSAFAYPALKQYPDSMPLWKRKLKFHYRHMTKVVRSAQNFSHPSMDVPLAKPGIFRKDPIVVYPEVITGNPFGASAVVRWILFTPGLHIGSEAGADPEHEEIFYFQKVFVEGRDWIPAENELRLHWIRTDIYFNRQQSNRAGSCRMRRKGELVGSDTSDKYKNSKLLDGLPHEEVAKVFNECEYFYCDDPHTMYSTYAVLCGCIAVVTPMAGVSEKDWRPDNERWGMAYGDSWDQIEFAKRTMHKMPERLAELSAAEERLLDHFIRRLAERFD